MSNTKSRAEFNMMAMALGLRDIFIPPMKKIRETTIQEGDSILDFGCGPGNIAIAAARAVGPSGLVYALDQDPLALESLGKKARKNQLKNIRTISSNGRINLPEASMDYVLMFDVFHELSSPEGILKEIHRILKPGGKLAVNDHHLNKTKIRKNVEKGSQFLFDGQEKISIFFKKTA
jgi:ubiquinone/menaquinone biosynthesis C-methylase UbiE